MDDVTTLETLSISVSDSEDHQFISVRLDLVPLRSWR